MKYFIFKQGATRGATPVKIVDSEPSDFMIGEMAIEFGPIQVIPELIQKGQPNRSAEQTEAYIQSLLPHGVKTNWKK